MSGMPLSLLAVTLWVASAPAMAADGRSGPFQGEREKTVCTVTVNSADEKQALAARLPKGRYRFVELVEKGREDWLRSACRKHVQCDVLVISGHFNAGETFYSDKLGVDEHLQVDELERAACSDSCPALFSHLKEVYLFGCESLNPDATKYSSSYGESGRDRMRRIFANVPQIYGFYSSAPVGPTAAMLLNRYFDGGGAGSFGTGNLNERLLRIFGHNHMTRVAGVKPGDAQYAYRAQVCQFFDERESAAQKLGFVHQLLRGDMAQARGFFKRIEKLVAAVKPEERTAPAFEHALAEISADDAARGRFLAFERNAAPGERVRMIDLATTLGWLTPEARRDEQLALVGDVVRQPRLGYADVDLVCAMNADRSLDAVPGELASMAPRGAAQAAALACVGNAKAHAAVLEALASGDERDVQSAQAYLRYRPLDDADLRVVARRVARMPGSPGQVRALESLALLNISDREVLAEMADAFAAAKSAQVQRAIAEVFIRSDASALPRTDLAGLVREHRIRAPDSRGDLVDMLLRQLSPSS
ncbi:MAG TPA: hypothetical protein VFE23_10140 [Usitatibacter sp.]|jgi:hypothetical protein|nr:hypothetical protein [Usitatibacter sp.]